MLTELCCHQMYLLFSLWTIFTIKPNVCHIAPANSHLGSPIHFVFGWSLHNWTSETHHYLNLCLSSISKGSSWPLGKCAVTEKQPHNALLTYFSFYILNRDASGHSNAYTTKGMWSNASKTTLVSGLNDQTPMHLVIRWLKTHGNARYKPGLPQTWSKFKNDQFLEGSDRDLLHLLTYTGYLYSMEEILRSKTLKWSWTY